MSDNKFTKIERNSVTALSAVVGLRMVGLFLILPVLALHANELSGTTPLLIGAALGIYGLTQAIFQIPFGIASDKWGRKPVITIGLIVFAAGSLIAAEADSIFGIIFGRALQGGGAISAAVLAFIGDMTRESQRNKAMAILGVSIGSAFTFSLMLGPALDRWVGLQGLFWTAFGMAMVGLALIWLVVPAQSQAIDSKPVKESLVGLSKILFEPGLTRFYSGTLAIHAVMTSLFIVVPGLIVEVVGVVRTDFWKVFVPVLLLSFAAMVPLIRFSSRNNRSYSTMVLAAVLLLVAECSLFAGVSSSLALIAGLWLFFVGFNTLEALLPSITIGAAPQISRGAVIGMFNTCTFTGAFIGGIAGGLVYGGFGASGVFAFSAIVILLWIFVAVATRSAYT